MATDGLDLKTLAARLEAIVDRLTDLEVQVHGLMNESDGGGARICGARYAGRDPGPAGDARVRTLPDLLRPSGEGAAEDRPADGRDTGPVGRGAGGTADKGVRDLSEGEAGKYLGEGWRFLHFPP
jgi:hypothetical protein